MAQIVIRGKNAEEIAKKVKRSIETKINEEINKKGRVIIGIAGPTSSGKSTIAKEINKILSKNYKTQKVDADMFYKNNAYKLKEIYGTFDHLQLIDFKEMRKVVEDIIKGKDEVEIPIYVFETATREGKRKESIKGKEVFLIDNIYVIEELGDLLDVKIYVKTHSKAEEIVRRLIRDNEERLNLDYETSLDLISSALLMYDIFGTRQEGKADVVVINEHSLFSRRAKNWGEVKIYGKSKIDKLREWLNKNKIKEERKKVWDYYYTMEGGGEVMRIREIIKDDLPQQLEISYKLYPFPFKNKNNKTSREEVHNTYIFSFRTSKEGMFVLTHVLARIAGFNLVEVVKNMRRERYKVEEDLEIIIDSTPEGEVAEIFGNMNKVKGLLGKVNNLL